MEQLVFDFEELPFPMPLPVEQKEIVLPDNRVIEIIKPIPLEDLMHMAEVIRDGHDSEKARELDQLGRGAFGTVLGYKEYAIKYFRDGISCYEDKGYGQNNLPEVDDIRDVYILKELQSIPSIPRLYAVVDGVAVIMERVIGETCDSYRRSVSEKNYRGNYISKKFNDVYEDAIMEITKLGFEPHDLHGENVMICKETGLPKIVDVGLFKKFEQHTLDSMKDKPREKILRMYPMSDAIYYISDNLSPFIDRKINPAKWKEIDAEKKKEKMERDERRKQEALEERKKRYFEHTQGKRKMYVHKDDNRPFY